MDIKKLKRLFILLVILLVLIIAVVFITGNIGKNNNKSNNNNGDDENRYVYNFGDTLNLEESRTEEETENLGTDFPELGVINDFYDESNVEYGDDYITLETEEGRLKISSTWQEETVAQNIKEPTFGTLEKFVSKRRGVSIRYKDVTLKDTENYIKELKELGYINVEMDDKNKKNDYYNFSAKNANDVLVILNYESGILVIDVY